jgi:hypothetical protein
MEKGEHWVYKAGAQQPVLEVKVLAIGTDKPARVKVEFVADEFEGKQDWVPPSRLKVPWGQIESFVAHEAAWAAVLAPSLSMPEGEDLASDWAMNRFLPKHIAERRHNHGLQGLTFIGDWEELSAKTGLSTPEIQALGYIEDTTEGSHVSWTATLAIAKALIARHQDEALTALDKEEIEERRRAVHGYITGKGKHAVAISPDICEQTYQEYFLPAAETVREWAGQEAVEQREEAVDLRAAVNRLNDLANEAVEVLLAAGNKTAAWKIHHALYPDANPKTWKPALVLERQKDAWWDAYRARTRLDQDEQRASAMHAAERKLQRASDKVYGTYTPWAYGD